MKDFEKLVIEGWLPLYRFIYRLCGDAEAAQELTQEAFLRAWKSRERHEASRASAKTWLYSIARNATIDWMRKQKLSYFSEMDSPEGEPFEDALEDASPLPDELFASAEAGAALERALGGLSPASREVIHLHDAEDMSFEEIARISSEPMNTVKSRHRRAIESLRKSLAERSTGSAAG